MKCCENFRAKGFAQLECRVLGDWRVFQVCCVDGRTMVRRKQEVTSAVLGKDSKVHQKRKMLLHSASVMVALHMGDSKDPYSLDLNKSISIP